MADFFLTKEEVKKLTGYQIVAHQLRILSAFGIKHQIARGRPVVLRSEVERILGSQSPHPSDGQSPTEPNWDALGA